MANTQVIDDTDVVLELQDRLNSLERYGVYNSLSELKNATSGTDRPYTLLTPAGRVDYSYVAGDFTGQDDDLTCIRLNKTNISTGALVRQSSSSLTLANGGAIVATSDFKTAQKAVDARSVQGGRLLISARGARDPITLYNRKVGIVGDGILTAPISPSTPDGVAIRGYYTQSSWHSVPVVDVVVKGIGTLQGTGYMAGPDVYSTGVEYVGRSIFSRALFDNFDKCISRPYGNIGLWVDDCQFESSNYHIWSQSNNATNVQGAGDLMHGGCIFVNRGHYFGAQKASIFINSPAVGTGQAVFENMIMEGNPGWCFYINAFPSLGGQPGVVIRNCWNELNYTAASVNVNGDVGKPGWGKFLDTSNVLIQDTAVGPMTIARSHVTTENCDLSHLTSVDIDQTSSLIHTRARMYSGTAPGLTESIAVALNANGLNSPFFRMPRPGTLRNFSKDTVFAWNAQTPLTFGGSASRTTTGVTDDPAIASLQNTQSLTINAGEVLFPAVFPTIPGGGAYLVLQILVKTFGNEVTARLNGSAGLGGQVTLNSNEYRCITGIIRNNGSAINGNSIYFTGPTSGQVILRFGGIALSAFTYAEDALSFANSRQFPAEMNTVYTVNNVVEKRTFDPTTITLPDLAQVVGTLIGDIGNGRKLSRKNP